MVFLDRTRCSLVAVDQDLHIIQRHIPEDYSLNIHRRWNLTPPNVQHSMLSFQEDESILPWNGSHRSFGGRRGGCRSGNSCARYRLATPVSQSFSHTNTVHFIRGTSWRGRSALQRAAPDGHESTRSPTERRPRLPAHWSQPTALAGMFVCNVRSWAEGSRVLTSVKCWTWQRNPFLSC